MQKSFNKENHKSSAPNLQSYFAETALLPTGWADKVYIQVDNDGWITDIKIGKEMKADMRFSGPLLPGMGNLHSHAFQRAMAGLAEKATGQQDSFWTWRNIMYQFLQKLTPENQQTIAAQLYVEMLKAGFTSVGEFHYLHHQVDGKPYTERTLTSQHIIAAAEEAGIAITHMPVLYAYSDFDKRKPEQVQKRFINNVPQILEMIIALKKAHKHNSQVTLGLAHHSLRAVSIDMIEEATLAIQQVDPNTPIHIHVAEQEKEVQDCLTFYQQRPVELLIDKINMNAHWCLVHATQMTDKETLSLAKCRAVAGLCPTTEANLGDGLFNLPLYINENGRFGIGSDSHISVGMIEELRLLEYGQRLLHRQRAILKNKHSPSTGRFLFSTAVAGGAQALARATGEVAIGKRADFIVLDALAPQLIGKTKDEIIDAMIFAGNFNPIRHVIAGGKQVIKDYHHVREREILERFKKLILTFS